MYLFFVIDIDNYIRGIVDWAERDVEVGRGSEYVRHKYKPGKETTDFVTISLPFHPQHYSPVGLIRPADPTFINEPCGSNPFCWTEGDGEDVYICPKCTHSYHAECVEGQCECEMLMEHLDR